MKRGQQSHLAEPGAKRHCKHGRAASPANPYKLVEISLPRRYEEATRAGSSHNSDNLTQLVVAKQQPENSAVMRAATAIVIPRCASWFHYRRVHRIEKLAFPQYFAKAQPDAQKLYTAYRDYMIDSYRANPTRRLSIGECALELPGGIRQLAAVHAFLEQWGLINLHSLDPELRLTSADTPDNAHPFHLLQSADSLGDTLEAIDFPDIAGLEEPSSLTDTEACQDAAASATAASSSSNCSSLKQQHRFSCLATGGELRGSSTRRNDWSDAELLALLEGIEMYKEDWGRIAERVGTGRTQEECIVQMLKLPIVDAYLDGAENALGPIAQQLVPFGQADNPVMCTVAFLASAVDPRVASAAAQAALAEYGQLGPEAGAASLADAAGRIASDILGQAARKGRQLAEVELCKIKALMLQLIEAQMKKLEVKLRQYQELEAFVDKEREAVEIQQLQVHNERQCLHQELIRAAQASACPQELQD